MSHLWGLEGIFRREHYLYIKGPSIERVLVLREIGRKRRLSAVIPSQLKIKTWII